MDSELEANQNALFNALGRCLVRVQSIELVLKRLLASRAFGGTVKELEVWLTARHADYATNTLGTLVNELLERYLVSESYQAQEAPDPPEGTHIYFRFENVVTMEGARLLEMRALFKGLVAARNDIVHHLVERFPLKTTEGCAEAHSALTAFETVLKKVPALHGALNHYLFEIHPQRVHPRFGISPNEKEEQLTLYGGARGHLMVRYDQVFKLLTAPYSEQPTRKLDHLRGIYVDGTYHWTNEFRGIPDGTALAVRVEPWNAEVIYVEVNKRWVVARARMAPHLTGRHRYELEVQIREERRRRKALATADKSRPEIASQSVRLWSPNEWDPRLREQQVEAYVLYSSLGMTEVLPEGVNEFATRLQAELPQGSQSRLLFEDDPPEATGVQPTLLPGPDIPTTNAAPPERESAPPSPRRMEPEPTEYDYF